MGTRIRTDNAVVDTHKLVAARTFKMQGSWFARVQYAKSALGDDGTFDIPFDTESDAEQFVDAIAEELEAKHVDDY